MISQIKGESCVVNCKTIVGFFVNTEKLLISELSVVLRLGLD